METKKQQKKPEKQKKRRRRLLWLLLPALLIAGAYVAFTIAASPKNLKEQITKAIRSCFDGQVHITKVRFNLFRGVIIRDLYLTGPNGERFVYIRKLILRHDLAQLPKLLQQKPIITEIYIEKPDISLFCSEDGWNAQQWIKPGGEFDVSAAPISSLTIEGGSVSVTDTSRVRRFPFLQLRDINVASRPAPDSKTRLEVNGTFADNIVGNWQIDGLFDVGRSALKLGMSRENIILDEKIRKHVRSVDLGPFPELAALDGTANLSFDFEYASALQSRLQYDLCIDLIKCRARLKRFPYTLDSITGRVQLKNGQISLDNIVGLSGKTTATAAGSIKPEREMDVSFSVEDLPIDDRLAQLLDETGRKAMEQTGLGGTADVTCRLARAKGPEAELVHAVTVHLKDCWADGPEMPFRVDKIDGTVMRSGHDLSLRGIHGHTPVGPFKVRDTTFGTDQDVTRSVEVELHKAPVDKLLAALGKRMPDVQKQVAAYKPKGIADVVCRVSWKRGGKDVWYDIQADFSDLSMAYPDIEQPLRRFAGKLRLNPRELVIETASGECGGHPLSMRSLRTDLKAKCLSSGQIKMEGWLIDKDLKAFVPESVRQVLEDLDLKGRLDVIQNMAPTDAETETVVALLDCSARYKYAPYPIRNITGRVAYKDGKISFHDVTGKNGSARVKLTTEMLDLDRRGPLKIALSAKDLPLDDQLKSVLPLSMIPYWDQFNPSGKVNVDLGVSFTPGDDENMEVTTIVDWNGSSLQYVDFPYPVSDVTGMLKILPDRIVLENMAGKAGTGHLRFHDTVIFRDEEYGMDITIKGSDIPLDNKLRECLRKDVQKAWDTVNPAGKFNFVWRQARGHGKDAATDYSVDIELANAEMKNEYFKYPLKGMTGSVHFANNVAEFENVVGKNGKATVSISGSARAEPGPMGELLHLKVEAKDIPLDQDLRNALPETYQGIWDEMAPKERPDERGTVSVSGSIRYREHELGKVMIEYELAPLTFHDCRMELGDVPLDNINGVIKLRGEVYPGEKSTEWTEETDRPPEPRSALIGSLDLREVTVARKKYTELEVDKFLARFYAGDDFEFHTDWIQAYLYGGRFVGSISIDRARKRFGDDEVHYSAEFGVKNVNVKDLVNLASVDVQGIKGTLQAESRVTGAGLKRDELASEGTMSIKDGDMGNLPQKFGIPSKLLKGTAFSEAHMTYRIKEGKALIKEFDLKGDEGTFKGRGQVPLDPDQPAELVFRYEGKRRLFPIISPPEITVKLGGPEGPIWSVDPLVPLRNLVRGLARVLQIKKAKENDWED